MRILFTPIRKKGTSPKYSRIYDRIVKAMEEKVKPRLLSYPERIVEPWEHRPQFVARVTRSAGRISLSVYPVGPYAKIWKAVSRGTGIYGPSGRPIVIVPKRAKALAFPSLYTPHTTTRGPGYKGPGRSSGETLVRRRVVVKGIKGRHFEEAWGRWAKPWFRKVILEAIKQGRKEA